MKRGSRKRTSRKSPRRKRSSKRWEPVYFADPSFVLAPSAVAELAEIASLEDREVGDMCQRVREVLAIYPSLQVAVDQAPRPAHLRRVLEHHELDPIPWTV